MMISRPARIAAGLIAACLMLAGAGCAPTDSDASAEISELVVAESAAPKTFDPIKSDVISTWYPWRLAYDTLVTSQPDGSLEPALAESWTVSDDGLLYTFTLREGVLFHNGETLTADDVAFTFTRLLDQAIPYTTARFSKLESATAVDDLTVEFRLTGRDAGFLSNLGDPFAVGSAILSKVAVNKADPAVAMVGTGPYRMVSYSPDQELVLERNDDYWGEPAANERLRIVYLPEQSAQTAALRSGQIDVMFPNAEATRSLEGADVTIKQITSGTVLQLEINTQTNPALADVRVREAIAHAINRDEIVEKAMLGSGTPSAQIPASLDFSVPLADLPTYTYDPKLSEKLLDEAGHGDGLALNLDVFSTASDSLKRSTEILESQLEAVGFDITINNTDFATWLEKFNSGNFDLIGNPTSYKADPFWYLKVRTNRHGPVPAESTQMEEAILNAPDQGEYIRLLQDYQKYQASIAWPNLSLAAEGMWVAYGPTWDAVEPPVSIDRSFLTGVHAASE